MSEDATPDAQLKQEMPSKPFFVFEFPAPIEAFSFEEPSDVNAFLANVERLYSGVSGGGQIADFAAKRVRDSLKMLRAAFTQVQTGETESPEDEPLDALRDAFNKAFHGKTSLPHPDSPQGKYIAQLKDHFSNDIVANTMGWMMGQGRDTHMPAIGITLGMLFDDVNEHWSGEAFGESLNTLHSTWQAKLNDVHESHRKNEQSRIGTFEKMIADNMENQESQQEHFDTLEGKYKAVQNVREPMVYWDTKRWWHLKIAGVTGALATAAGGFGAWGLVAMSGQTQAAIGKLDTVNGWSLLPHSFPTLVVGVAVYWVVRILVKLCMTNVHLATDASERVVMAKTFISLLVDEKTAGAIKAHEDLRIILEQLFRHQPVGLIRYDGGPANQSVVGRMTGD